ncbi:16S rRNA (guanine(527)-N(7))-methyltransferase RsmG [Polynucleobacter sp. 30F-ANTBAC]|uniref:16S rRNA (guanine(527)-N(7))-methyltransferase RsmG n=1 Tax=Polynucleobacter sp. 30F-ANTBAC TaxID=2689095 RepID=UPI001C0B5C8C|nr:16S rRNA (guanine(527)-N(7))-methyltransferase RsmG [Polynucleobacter sp. 30F-ANTBAC]MBU3600010.1 16S rRNA (guanine(527)-N(7))-methyltransferase RsmG [Polynucleobacter sp. 30F-ANTBAC]
MQQELLRDNLLSELNQGVTGLALNLSSEQLDSLVDYLLEFQRWNKTHNLSAIRELKDSVTLHLLDSLSVLPYLDDFVAKRPDPNKAFALADLGTGGGLPGIPLAICRPEWRIHLMEAVQKKTVFLQHIVSKFHLENVKVHPARIEESSKKLQNSISICISRAFSDFGKFITLSEPMLEEGGEVWAMKAKLLQEDLNTIPSSWQITNNYLLQVPGLEAERRLFELAPVRELKA